MFCVLNNTIKMVFVYRPHYAKTDLGRQSLKINKNKKNQYIYFFYVLLQYLIPKF